MSDFGHCLSGLRAARGLSQARAARAAGCERSSISRLESGSRSPSRRMALTLADALGATDAERDELLTLAGYVSDTTPINDPLAAELAGMLADKTLPDLARHYLRSSVEAAMYLARVRSAQLEAV